MVERFRAVVEDNIKAVRTGDTKSDARKWRTDSQCDLQTSDRDPVICVWKEIEVINYGTRSSESGNQF